MKTSEIRRELKAACTKGRLHVLRPGISANFRISRGWTVHVEAEYNTPRGGPMKAWKHLYYLLPPVGRQRLGGYDRADSFCAWATQFITTDSARCWEKEQVTA